MATKRKPARKAPTKRAAPKKKAMVKPIPDGYRRPIEAFEGADLELAVTR